jgi:transposase
MGNSLIFIEKQVYKIAAHFGGQIPKGFCEDIPATSTANLSAINRNTVQRIFTLLRDRIVEMAIEESKLFVRDIEVDESYFGPKRVRGKSGRGESGKIPVLGLQKRQGRAFLASL